MSGYLSPEGAQSLTFVDQPGAGRLTGSIASDCLVGAFTSDAKRRSAVEMQPGAGGLTCSIDRD